MSNDVKITPEIVKQHGFTEEEYDKLVSLLKREPNYNELGVYSVMWSEHCGYKNSKPLLKTLPTKGPLILQGPGENAGIVDIGDGYAVVFKIESHNHPSAVEPYQGAATGVGGILRDIFTMGSRPVAMLNSLRFGSLSSEKTKRLFRGVVKGIGDYGNCVGIPTVAGEIYFDPIYEDNILVNAMCVGLIKKENIVRATASGVGNHVLYFGSTTGRDGIHGATFASEELSEEGEDKRPSVQVGDPFTEKILLEATLEIITSGLVEGIQDMGAAGLTSSSCEMAARAGTGIQMDLDKIPKRADDLTAYEMLLSESQERMLAVVTEEKLPQIMKILKKWDIYGVVIGEVTDTGYLKVMHKGEEAANIPVSSITDDVPTYTRPVVRPLYLKDIEPVPELKIEDYSKLFLQMVKDPNIASKSWVFAQYDYMVKTDTVIPPGKSGASLVRIKGTKKGIAVTTDCNAAYCYLDPKKGASIAVTEAARNLASIGAKPLAVTNCLNFSNPEKSEIYYQLAKCIEGMSDACKVMDTPVTGGNASLYNETNGRPIYPTPVIGMVGLVEDIDKVCNASFKQDGDIVYLIGETQNDLGGSLLVKILTGKVLGDCPDIDLDKEKKTIDSVVSLIQEGLLSSCTDVADGGLLIAIAESCFGGNIGVKINYTPDLSSEAILWSETQGRYLISVKPGNAVKVEEFLIGQGLSISKIGKVGSRMLQFNDLIRMPVQAARDIYFSSIESKLEGQDKLNGA